MVEPLKIDNEMATKLAEGLRQYSEIVSIGQVHINMIKFQFNEGIQVDLEEMKNFLLGKGIKIKVPNSGCKVRLMTHHYIREKEVELALSAFREFFEAIRK